MQNKRYKLGQLALVHLRKVKEYTIESFSEAQWQSYKATLLSGLQVLANNPDLGRSCANIYNNGFYYPIAKHTVYFTKEEDFILVVAVLNQSQLPQKHLK